MNKQIIEAIKYLANAFDSEHEHLTPIYYEIKEILEPKYTRKECGCNKDEACFTCNPELMMEDDELYDDLKKFPPEEELNDILWGTGLFDLEEGDKLVKFFKSQITKAQTELADKIKTYCNDKRVSNYIDQEIK